VSRGRGSTVAESRAVSALITAVALAFLAVFVILPLAAVFGAALGEGVRAYFAAVSQPETLESIRLTVFVALVAVPVNTVGGVAAAWLIARHTFVGRGLLLALIELPLSISPVIAGLLFVLLFGRRGTFGPFLTAHQIHVLFAVPGVVLATSFVTFPFVARELLPVLEAQGIDEEEAAMTLGARGWQVFFRVTLPKVRLGLVTGVVLCAARALGEFGAVSVVSGHVRGLTETLPLEVEMLYNEYNFVGAFAAASLLTVVALVTLGAKRWIEQEAAA
jgi:sulfate transport system permease protein